MKRAGKLVAAALVLAALIGPAVAHAGDCSAGLAAADLTEVLAQTAALSEDFRQAFLTLPLDDQPGSTQTVGATLVGSSMANEIAATAAGLRQLVALRDRLQESDALPVVRAQLAAAMAEAAMRMRKVSMRYGSSAKMAMLPNVRDLAAEGMQLADGLANQWSCQ